MTLSLPFEIERPKPVREAISRLANESNKEKRGAVFTKPEVVEGILNLCCYTVDRPLQDVRLLEPSFGTGEFLFPVIRRLIESCNRQQLSPSKWRSTLSGALFAVELHKDTFLRTQDKIVEYLQSEGMYPKEANDLTQDWLKQDDFLLTEIREKFDVILGNPPYVRQERVPTVLLNEYKHSFSTLYDRADLYVLFFERSLDLLSENGVLGFICANRWVKNKYGGPLRGKIAAGFNLDVYIDLEKVSAFQDKVDAYPAITIIRRAQTRSTTIVRSVHNKTTSIEKVFNELQDAKRESPNIHIVTNLMSGRDPWLLDAREVLEYLRQLENRLPCLEESGAKVGIGVATGCDKVFIGPHNELPVEEERKLPLVLASDLDGQTINWGGGGIVNPWTNTGALASLNDFPKFADYLNTHEVLLRKRHTAKRNPSKWYKTIDRIYPNLRHTPKLLIPDIKGDSTVVYDSGLYYPHHNLYVITSETWDLQVLQAFLRSSIALMFVAAYSVRMAGGFLRFQAQYLRRIRVPHWHDINPEMRVALRNPSILSNQKELDRLVAEVYGLPQIGTSIICDFAANARVSGLKKVG